MIPRRFIRIFLDEPVPERFEAYWDGFKALHPGWEFLTLDDSNDLDWMRCRRTFDEQGTHAGRSDVLRYAALWHFGGVYVDTDVEPLQPFDELLDGKPFIAWEDERMLCPTVMGAPPQHPAIGLLLDQIPMWSRQHRYQLPNRRTGPYFVTRFWRFRTDIRTLPPVSFYPVPWQRKEELGGPYPAGSWAVHHWAGSWVPQKRKAPDDRSPRKRAAVSRASRAGLQRPAV